ncbi:MAG TPA: secretin N-terminal domain-containing protein [Burkholderiales bacterium]|nr:secretin N-terminal domain-containing protein [Burkholderiales bacterium]
MKHLTIVLGAALGLLSAACGHQPMEAGETHISGGEVTDKAPIPPPVQISPVLPKPKPVLRPETYSVVVNNVRVQELLFALARDARLQIDIDPSLAGTVTLNAIDQTLPQLLTRIGRQVDMRYEFDGDTLIVMRDTPYLRVYRVDYVNLSRDARVVAGMAMQVSGTTNGGTAGGAGGGGQNNSTATVSSISENRFWATLIDNVKAILRETDKVIPASLPAPAAAVPGAAPGATPAPLLAAAAPATTFLEAGSVIASPESGLLTIRATARQHERIQEFLDQVLANARRQVLIEATVAEVRLSSQYQRGIDWQRLRTGAAQVGVPAFGTGQSGLEFSQRSNATRPGFNENQFIFGGAITSLNLNFAFKLLETFGDVRVLSSPKLSVLNNQFAVLKVVDNLVYFNVSSQTTQAANAGTLQSITTTANTVPVGLIMTVVPQISDHDSISLSVRPSISRLLRFVQDPNPLLTTVGNFIPEIQTREMESVLRMESGQVAVLGGLMEDIVDKQEDAIPGVRNVPGVGQIFSQRSDQNRKTELVIFLRATVIRDASIEGDYRGLRSLLPQGDFLTKPHPGRAAPPLSPMEAEPR